MDGSIDATMYIFASVPCIQPRYTHNNYVWRRITGLALIVQLPLLPGYH